ncbi:MAG: M14-type cytosolic carboxypeptidase [Thermaurantiacus sp.]
MSAPPIVFCSAFDSGNGRLLRIESPATVTFSLEDDAGGQFRQWFHVRLSHVRGLPLVVRIVGLNDSAYPGGWPGYAARVSEDRHNWRTAESQFSKTEEGGTLTINLAPQGDSVWLAYFVPYSMERHHDLVARMALSPGVVHRVLGASLDGQPIDCLTIGEGPLQCWFTARQHPGETMAEWWMEGALEALIDPSWPFGQRLRARATLHLIPNMNPDGSSRGFLRTNAAGANLNREWHDPKPDRSPEVLAARNAMDATGVDFALDVHGDEALPHAFIAGFEGIPSATPHLLGLLEQYKARLLLHAPDFQTRVGYPVPGAGKANLSMATNQIAERFRAVAATLEMPFKDSAELQTPTTGWSPDRSKHLARACLAALDDLLDDLR